MELDKRGAELLFQGLTEREEKTAVAVASNDSFSGWDQDLHRPTAVRRGTSPRPAQQLRPRARPVPTQAAMTARRPSGALGMATTSSASSSARETEGEVAMIDSEALAELVQASHTLAAIPQAFRDLVARLLRERLCSLVQRCPEQSVPVDGTFPWWRPSRRRA